LPLRNRRLTTNRTSSKATYKLMSLVRSIRLTLKYVRRFIAGFASVPTFAFGKMRKFPFAEHFYALEQDKREVASDIETTSFKIRQNERKQKQVL
jgi:hypothetical protein